MRFPQQQINQPKFWPPGSIMLFDSKSFFGVGLVVSNIDKTICVLWDESCNDKFSIYDVTTLNPAVIKKL